jgi:multiple sugar transport system permease protein
MTRKRKNVSYSKFGYIFSIPFVVAFLTFLLYPLGYTIYIGFTDLEGAFMKAEDATWLTRVVTREVVDENGNPVHDAEGNPVTEPVLDAEGKPMTELDIFGNFRTVLSHRSFQVSFINTWKIWLINFIPQIVLALVLTAWFTNRRHKIRFQGAFKVLFYMPNIITAASIAILFNALFMFPIGPVNWLFSWAGLPGYNFIRDQLASQLIVAFIQFWMWYGYTMLVLISGVLGLNPEMYEVSEIDGANGIQQFFFITLPNLRTILLYTLVTSLVGGMNMFDVPRLFNNGGPDYATSTLAQYIYGQAFSGISYYNRAAAASLIMFVLVAFLSACIFLLLRDSYEAKEKKLARRARREARRAAKLAQLGGASA